MLLNNRKRRGAVGESGFTVGRIIENARAMFIPSHGYLLDVYQLVDVGDDLSIPAQLNVLGDPSTLVDTVIYGERLLVNLTLGDFATMSVSKADNYTVGKLSVLASDGSCINIGSSATLLVYNNKPFTGQIASDHTHWNA